MFIAHFMEIHELVQEVREKNGTEM